MLQTSFASTSSSGRSMWDQFMCTDTLTHTLLFLDAKSIVQSCSLVSKQWNKLSNCNTLWKLIYNQLLMNNQFKWKECISKEAKNPYKYRDDDADNDDTDVDMDELIGMVNQMMNESNTTTIGDQQQERKPLEEKSIDNDDSDDVGTNETYWFDLFRQHLMILPIMDEQYHQLSSYIGANDELINRITDIEELRKITFFLKTRAEEASNNCKPIGLDIQYKCEHPPTHYVLRANYLRLVVILTVMYNQYSISYLTDHVVISLRDFHGDRQYQEEDQQQHTDHHSNEFICPILTFCMMVLYPTALQYLPFKESYDDEGRSFRLCVAPFMERESSSTATEITNERVISNKDCCFFTRMNDRFQRTFNELIFQKSSDTRGFKWCPQFFNAGGAWYFSKIHACFVRDDKFVQVRRYEDTDYY